MGSYAKDTTEGQLQQRGTTKTKKMLVTFKTLDHKIFKLDVASDETVSDLKCRLEDDMGRDNIYKLIYSGKILKDDSLVSSYNINQKHFVVLMITRTKPPTASTIEPTRVDREVTEAGSLPSTSSGIGFPKIESEDKPFLEKQREHDEEIKQEMKVESCLQSANNLICDNKEQEQEVVGLDWIEEQIKEKESHFVTEREFCIALDVVMNTEYLADDGNHFKTAEGVSMLLKSTL